VEQALMNSAILLNAENGFEHGSTIYQNNSAISIGKK
jgi:hypothetical protein